MAEKIIIDVDTGVDDAQAIILALSRPELAVQAITCVAGNCDVDAVCLNTLKVLAVCKRLDIPVFRGAEKALSGDVIRSYRYHGDDGLGNADLDIDVSLDQMQKEPAATALVRLVNERQGEISLIALAPLTNIAQALRLDPHFGKKLKRVTMLGGNLEGKGNISLCGEFNFTCDPEAARVVLDEIRVPVNLVPWNCSLANSNALSWEWFDAWIDIDTAIGRFNKSIIKRVQHSQRVAKRSQIYRSCDLLALATLVNADVVVEAESVYATVELQGTHTRGMLVADWRNLLDKLHNITLVTRIDATKARPLFDEMIKTVVLNTSHADRNKSINYFIS